MRTITLKELQVKLEQGIPQSVIDKALNRAGLIVENDAKERCPVGKTGQLRNSIEHRVQGANYKTECVVGTNLEYAPYVEFGTGIYAVNGDGRQTPWVYRTADGEFYFTVGQKPQPYLLPALEENTEQINQEILNTIKENLFK